MKKLFVFFNILLIVAVVIGDAYYISKGTLRIKALVSILFTLLGAVNLLYANLARMPLLYPVCIAVGLFFAMLGDIMLGHSFVCGAMLFAVGHIIFLLSFCIRQPLKAWDLFPIAVIATGAAAFLLCYPKFRFGSREMLYVCLSYAIIISGMTGKSIANFFHQKNPVHLIAMIGSIFFFISDLMLVLYKFSRAPGITDTLCLVFYYPSVCLIGHSVYHHVRRAVKS